MLDIILENTYKTKQRAVHTINTIDRQNNNENLYFFLKSDNYITIKSFIIMATANVTAHSAQTLITQFSVTQISQLDSVRLPEIIICGIPWIVEVRKIRKDGELVMGIFLYCGHRDRTSNWTYVATASFKLVPFAGGDGRGIEYNSIPHVFDRSGNGFGANSFIKWVHLFKPRYRYVQNDSIELEIKIKAEDPNHLNRSILQFECIDQSCDCYSQATYRLTVLNVTNLMAVATPAFKSRGLLWNIIVFKEHSSSLGVLLQSKTSFRNVSCQMTMTVRLMSSNQQYGPIQMFGTERMQWPKVMYIRDIVAWDELIKPENGIINQNDDSIVFEVEIKSEQPNGNIPNAEPNYPPHLLQMECAVCLENIISQDISCAPCGHMHCTACITANIRARGVCPSCGIPVKLTDLRRLFLPV